MGNISPLLFSLAFRRVTRLQFLDVQQSKETESHHLKYMKDFYIYIYPTEKEESHSHWVEHSVNGIFHQVLDLTFVCVKASQHAEIKYDYCPSLSFRSLK